MWSDTIQLKPLPGLAFGSLTGSGASGAVGQPILKNNAAITEYMNQAAFAINQILGEGIENVKERIANDFAGTDGDHYEVVNPYEGDLISNANLFISQYCAAKNLDFAAISLTDMEQILRAGLTHLYSFSRTMEVRTVPAEEDGEEDTAETWYIYTIRYNGEVYFADTIFALTDKQKNLAKNYAENLSLFLGDGLFQYAPSTNTITALSDVRFTDGETEIIYFNQLDERIVLRGVQDEKILVADPASYRRSQKAWELSIILNEASRHAGAGGPFWVIG